MNPFARYVLMILAVLALPSCDLFTNQPPQNFAKRHVPRVEKPHYTADAFIQHLTLVKLALSSDMTAMPALEDDLDVLQTYVLQKPDKLSTPSSLVVALEYDGKNYKNLQQALAPLPKAAENGEFHDLLEIMQALSTTPYTLHNIHLFVVTVVPSETLRKSLQSARDGSYVLSAVQEQQQLLLANASRLPFLDDAEQQLQLMQFFIAHRLRDAAYLSADNVKRLLGAASQSQPQDAERTHSLLQRLDMLEAQLHSTMPFTL